MSDIGEDQHAAAAPHFPLPAGNARAYLAAMPSVNELHDRLDAIGAALAASGHARALIGLGSAGLERARLDEWSDLDFFVIVKDGWKQRYIDEPDWLRAPAPLAYVFRNTPDGCKALYEDGIFCEFAVFERHELSGIPFAPGRIVWRHPGEDASLASPSRPLPTPEFRDPAWLLGEALTNLYVGLCRFRRGEKLSGGRFVQQFAVDRVIELCGPGNPSVDRDPFAPERRVEQRFPELAGWWPRFVPGYERTPEAAVAILDFLAARFPVNETLARAIRHLAG